MEGLVMQMKSEADSTREAAARVGRLGVRS